MKITIGKSDKFTLPNVYESTGTTFSAEFELDDSLTPEERQAQLLAHKQEFEKMYWALANWDIQTFFQRLQYGTQAFVTAKAQQ